jgi:hypothetical protein
MQRSLRSLSATTKQSHQESAKYAKTTVTETG